MKTQERRKARALRRKGWSIREITKEIRCAKSSVSLLVRDIEITPAQAARLKANMSHPGLQGACKRSIHTCGRCDRQYKAGTVCACRSARKCILCGQEHRATTLRCPSCITKIRRIRGKLAAITYLGGKCQNPRCPARGRKIHPSGLEFHHRYGKDFAINAVHNRSWEVAKAELDKTLLCSVCHQEVHTTRFDDEAFIRDAKRLGNSGFDLEIDWGLLPK